MKRVRVVLRHQSGETSQDYRVMVVMSEDNYYEASLYSHTTDDAIPTLLYRKDGFTNRREAEDHVKRWAYEEMVRWCLTDLEWEVT